MFGLFIEVEAVRSLFRLLTKELDEALATFLRYLFTRGESQENNEKDVNAGLNVLQ